jgi:hypothetical protein
LNKVSDLNKKMSIHIPKQPKNMNILSDYNIYLKTSDNESGYYKVGIEKKGKVWKYKAFKPGNKGKMISKSEGGGLFYTAKEASISYKRYCINHGLEY